MWLGCALLPGAVGWGGWCFLAVGEGMGGDLAAGRGECEERGGRLAALSDEDVIGWAAAISNADTLRTDGGPTHALVDLTSSSSSSNYTWNLANGTHVSPAFNLRGPRNKASILRFLRWLAGQTTIPRPSTKAASLLSEKGARSIPTRVLLRRKKTEVFSACGVGPYSFSTH